MIWQIQVDRLAISVDDSIGGWSCQNLRTTLGLVFLVLGALLLATYAIVVGPFLLQVAVEVTRRVVEGVGFESLTINWDELVPPLLFPVVAGRTLLVSGYLLRREARA